MRHTLDYINTFTDNFEPEIGIILGSGLGELADKYQEFAIPYKQIHRFPRLSSVDGFCKHCRAQSSNDAGQNALLRRLFNGAGHISY